MKKAYVKPSMESEAFLPQDYIAACYIVNCNVPSFKELWLETNGQAGLQTWGRNPDTKELDAGWNSIFGCNEYHKGVTKNPEANAYITGNNGRNPRSVFAWQEDLGSDYDWHASLMDMQDWETNPNAS